MAIYRPGFMLSQGFAKKTGRIVNENAYHMQKTLRSVMHRSPLDAGAWTRPGESTALKCCLLPGTNSISQRALAQRVPSAFGDNGPLHSE